MKRTLSGSVNLAKLVSVMTSMTGKAGTPVKGLFIPFEPNHILATEKGNAYLNVRVIIRDEPDQYGQHGFIAQTVDSEKYKAASEDEKKALRDKLPILGNLKDFERPAEEPTGLVRSYANEQPSFLGDVPPVDDLPF